MRFFSLALFVLFVFSLAYIATPGGRYAAHTTILAATAFVNDSVIIEINEAGPPNAPPEDTVTGIDASASGGANAASGGNVEGSVLTFPDGGSGTSGSALLAPVITDIIAMTTTAPSSGDSGASGSITDGTSGSSGSEIVSAVSIVAALIGNQALTMSSAVGASGSDTSGGGTGSSDASGTSATHIITSRVRDSLAARGIVQLEIPDAGALFAPEARRTERFTERDFAIVVSAAALSDEYLGDVDFSGGVLDTKYRALGWLFGFVPLRYPLAVSLMFFEGREPEVRVRFPWYKFLLRTGISSSALERDIQNTIATSVPEHGATFDAATRAFSAVEDILMARAGV